MSRFGECRHPDTDHCLVNGEVWETYCVDCGLVLVGNGIALV